MQHARAADLRAPGTGVQEPDARFLADEAIRLMRASSVSIEAAVRSALGTLARVARAERAVVLPRPGDGWMVDLGHWWPDGAGTARPEPLTPAAWRTFERGGAAYPTASGIALPVRVDGRVRGAIRLDLPEETRVFGPATTVAFRPDASVVVQPGTALPLRPATLWWLCAAADLIGAAIDQRARLAVLEASERRYRSMLDDLDAVVMALDGDGRISYLSEAWTEATGVPAAEMIKLSPLSRVHPDDRDRLSGYLSASRSAGELELAGLGPGTGDGGPVGGLDPVTVRFRSIDDRDVRMEVRAGVLRDDWGIPVGTIATMIDVPASRPPGPEAGRHAREDARRELDQARRDLDQARRERDNARRECDQARRECAAAQRARDRAERASQAKSEFLSRMNHELRTPLNAILGFAELLDPESLPAQDAGTVEHIRHAGQHLLTIVNDSLDVARIESGRLSIRLDTVPLAPIIAESISLLGPVAAANLVTVVPPETGTAAQWVRADPRRLKQVMVNLLSNGIKYNHPGGEVLVSCVPVGVAATEPGTDRPTADGVGPDRIRISVRDTGCGIPADQIRDIFLPFERLETTPNHVEGTGLGLAVTKSLVEAMHGTVGVESVEGAGTTFHVDVPLAPER